MSVAVSSRKPAVVLAESESDRNSLLELVQQVLTDSYEFCNAGRSEEAAQYCSASDKGIIFVRDLVTGLDLLEKPLKPGTSIILIIDDQDEDFVHTALARGAHDYVLWSQCSPPALRAAWKRADARCSQTSPHGDKQVEFQKAAIQLAHDLKQPIQSISFYLHAIRLNLGKPDADVETLVTQAIGEVGRFNEIIQSRLGLTPGR